ncbi:sodium/calcium exchanger protein [Candidatus Halobonum tyrrellensis]|uniref:Sodium/calcium exchanger membrane region n=1 Tax=Candidatus Halobonum tyrrellensis G22 TaxID=1324957 RepID=V4IZH8_9EURY|nr:sodium/calcium exchanger membrane region [Candidatus Halobonum tyrrellensis]ESP88537.1 sodium/calcium exchanger membrane region [Candidatus Halobonum tyrrellensis G22]
MSAVDRFRHPLVAVLVALVLTVPWIGTFLSYGGYGTVHPGENVTPVTAVVVAGLAILGAAFLLAWAAETAEKDVPQAFAIAVLAVLAVAPEYAVDALYAWEAGTGSMEAANLAVANMTGANRILIGLGWSGIALFTIYRAKRTDDAAVEHRSGFLADVVGLDRKISTEIAFLLAATAYAFFVPLGGGVGPLDTFVLVGLYVLYLLVIIRGDVAASEEHVGVPAYFQQWSKVPRIAVVLAGFAFSGAVIFTAVHPFAEGLERLGLQYGIPQFFMIQWLAPLASESPELIVVAYLVNKARSTAGFNALISSKLNQWTLLVGTLAVVYSISAGAVGTLPFDSKQAAEIWITAAQSLFAVAILTNFEISVREAVGLLVLFLTQVLAEFYVIRTYAEPAATEVSMTILYAYTAVYVLLGVGLFATRRESLRRLGRRTASTARAALGSGSGSAERVD